MEKSNNLLMKIVMFPLTILKYSKKGVLYLFGKNENLTNTPKIKKLEGVDLDKELERVKKESNEFNREEQEEVKQVERAKLKSFRYVVKGSNGNIVKGILMRKIKMRLEYS